MWRYGAFHDEEPIPCTDLDGLAQVAAPLDIPVAVGEQQQTRWDFKDMLDRKAVHIVQPDVTACGQSLRGKKIAALADAFGGFITTHTPTVSVGLAAHLRYRTAPASASIWTKAPSRGCPEFLLTLVQAGV